jgi:hypothetical protein
MTDSGYGGGAAGAVEQGDFYNEWSGHPVRDLQVVLHQLRRSNGGDGSGERSVIFLAGDSSLDNKYWILNRRPARAINGYERVLRPPVMVCDVAYWLNHALVENGDGERFVCLNTAIEATTLRQRQTRLCVCSSSKQYLPPLPGTLSSVCCVRCFVQVGVHCREYVRHILVVHQHVGLVVTGFHTTSSFATRCVQTTHWWCQWVAMTLCVKGNRRGVGVPSAGVSGVLARLATARRQHDAIPSLAPVLAYPSLQG